jgi:hypothetical protein
MEGKEWVWDNGLLKEHEVQQVYDRLKNAPASQLDEAILDSFYDLLIK